MRVLKLVVQYDGTAYVGWQRQKSGPSIQGLLEDALAGIVRQPVTVNGAGRTDAGVHALGQVASVRVDHGIESPAVARALNAALPADIRVIGVEDAAPEFHARFAARAKAYRYRIVTGEIASTFERHYCWHVPGRLDFAAMVDAAQPLEGRHDFAAFQSTGSARVDTVRTLSEVTLSQSRLDHAWYDPGSRAPNRTPDGTLIEVELTGDGFLRHMVRAIVGTLVDVGTGRRSPNSLHETLESRDRSRAGPTAPPQGLFLLWVAY